MTILQRALLLSATITSVVGFTWFLTLSGELWTGYDMIGNVWLLSMIVAGVALTLYTFNNFDNFGLRDIKAIAGFSAMAGLVPLISHEALNRHGPPRLVERVELPVVKREIKERRSRRRGPIMRVLTLDPEIQLGGEWLTPGRAVVMASPPGNCFSAEHRVGYLGAAWLDFFRSAPCDARRGPPGPSVIVADGRWRDWRWHRPQIVSRTDGAIFDAALPPGMTCQTRLGEEWLLECRTSAINPPVTPASS